MKQNSAQEYSRGAFCFKICLGKRPVSAVKTMMDRYGVATTSMEPKLTKIKLRDGETMLIMVKDGAVVHFTPNMGLPLSEFVKRATGELPIGAWVGTVSKLGGEVAAITSKHFFGY